MHAFEEITLFNQQYDKHLHYVYTSMHSISTLIQYVMGLPLDPHYGF
jgi:hypothetical protein